MVAQFRIVLVIYCALILLSAGFVVGPWSGVAVAAPFVPQNDAKVLERLRTAPLDQTTRELRQLRAQLTREPDNLELAARLAKRYIEQGRAESDPRYYGRAQAALAPWWGLPEPPPVILILRATIRQNRHDFDAAMDDLSLTLKTDPSNAQAWVTRAVIFQVRGEYNEAKRSCLPLLRLSTELVTATCLSSVSSLSGQAAQSYKLLRRVFDNASSASSSERLWALTVLAEIAARTGQHLAAEGHFKQALALGLPDSYLLSSYADFLLDQGRFAEVVALLKDETRADALLLRLALAEQVLHAPALSGHVAALRARFAANRLRGDIAQIHRREEARFTLQLLKQADEALRLAQENWTIQREPLDARVFLESALAVKNPAAAKPVLDWLEETKLEDVQLTWLSQQLRSMQP